MLVLVSIFASSGLFFCYLCYYAGVIFLAAHFVHLPASCLPARRTQIHINFWVMVVKLQETVPFSTRYTFSHEAHVLHEHHEDPDALDVALSASSRIAAFDLISTP